MNIVITFGTYTVIFFRSFVENNPDTKIDCTQLTADLVVMRQNVSFLRDYIIYIEPNKKYSITVSEKVILDVKMIPANHGIGSVMFLFDDSNKTILYTGDFRYDIRDQSEKAFIEDKNMLVIDYLYCDIAYAVLVDTVKPALKKFPSKEQS